jgi:hypothetical protein
METAGIDGESERRALPPHGGPAAIDATTILDNVVRLDQMLDEGSRCEVGRIPILELSKHLRIRKPDAG